MGVIKITKEMENLSPEELQEAKQLFSRGLNCAKEKNYADAKNYFEKAAACGHSGAQNNLGILYRNGLGVNKNPQKAFELYLESARHGNITAMRNLAGIYLDGIGIEKNFDAAIAWLETAAEQHDYLACNMLAKAYDDWSHRDEEKKIYWHKKAAEFGNADSMFFLGEHYKKDANNKNLTLARDYFDQAAKTGNFEMKLKVAQAFDMPSISYGEPLDLERARFWYTEVTFCDKDDLRLEAAKGLDEMMDHVGNVKRPGLDVTTAYNVYRTLANKGNRKACSLAAYCCEIGKGTIPDIDLAITLYTKAEEKEKADWCRKKKSGSLSDAIFESHKQYEVPDCALNVHSQGKELYSSNNSYIDDYEYNGRIYYFCSPYIVSSDLEGENIKIICEINDYNGCDCICVNISGIYLYTARNDERGDLRIVHFDFDGKKIGEYKKTYDENCEERHFVHDLYIYDNILYFVCTYIDESWDSYRAEIKRINIDEDKVPEVIYDRAISVSGLLATDGLLVFNASYENADLEDHAYGCMLMDLRSRKLSSLSNPYCSPENILDHPEKYDYDSPAYDENTRFKIDIVFFDMSRKIFWSQRSSLEGEDSAHLKQVFYWEPHYLVRNPEEIIPNYPIWRVPAYSHNRGHEYFDGKFHYYAESYHQFKSTDKFGNIYDWSKGNGGHGVCDQFRVRGNYLFLNIAAYNEEEYNLTTAFSQPIRKSWFHNTLPKEAIDIYERKKQVLLKDISEADLYIVKKISETDIKYNICRFGAEFHIGFGIPVTMRINGREYHCKAHNSEKGRIGSMKALYEDNGIKLGDMLEASYSASDRSINLIKL